MTKPIALCLALASLVFQPTAAIAAGPALPDLDSQLRCAVLFAFVANEQDNHNAKFARFPSMDKPGEAFFNQTVVRVQAERSVKDNQLMEYIMEQGKGLIVKAASSDDPDAAIDEAMAGCLPMFTQIAPKAAPGK
ncbi:MAG: hypothetical protein ABL914_13015 [Novosphingobium sp.]|uniref:hypothetical protein n=1 Tax=Novosphingobium sp. TaxID=1874826 RepID=UPI0032BE82E7